MRALLQSLSCGILALGLAAAPLGAQQLPDSLVGRRVQVILAREPFPGGGKAPAQVLRGTVLTLTPDTLTLRLHPNAGAVAVAVAGVDRLEVSRGIRSRTEEAARGALAGAWWFGFTWWAVDSNSRNRVFEKDWQDLAFGAAIGAVLGGVAHATRVERWKKVRLR